MADAGADKKKVVAFTDVTVAAVDGGFAVHLDAKTLKTPAGVVLVSPTRALAEAIAAEFRATGGRPRPAALPLTRMAGTALDRVARHRAEIEQQLLDYAETELLCHRADAPPDLVARQHQAWQPLLDWLAHRHDALLTATAGIHAKAQPAASLSALRAVLAGFDAWRLAALSVAVSSSGSLVVGLALIDGHLTAAAAFDAAELEGTFQIERWGEDAEAAAHRAEVRADLALAEQFLRLATA
jgi:chaperone required for assembly of F1-ATPase